MATRQYKDPSDYDSTEGHFTTETVSGQLYLKIGSLNANDQTLIEAVEVNQFVGFFQNGTEQIYARVNQAYTSANGLGLEEAPASDTDDEAELTVDADYEIYFTQERPRADGDGTDGERGSLWSVGTEFPTTPNDKDAHLFSEDVADGLTWKDTDGTTDLTSADEADIAQYNGTDWVKKLNIKG